MRINWDKSCWRCKKQIWSSCINNLSCIDHCYCPDLQQLRRRELLRMKMNNKLKK